MHVELHDPNPPVNVIYRCVLIRIDAQKITSFSLIATLELLRGLIQSERSTSGRLSVRGMKEEMQTNRIHLLSGLWLLIVTR